MCIVQSQHNWDTAAAQNLATTSGLHYCSYSADADDGDEDADADADTGTRDRHVDGAVACASWLQAKKAIGVLAVWLAGCVVYTKKHDRYRHCDYDARCSTSPPL